MSEFEQINRTLFAHGYKATSTHDRSDFFGKYLTYLAINEILRVFCQTLEGRFLWQKFDVDIWPFSAVPRGPFTVRHFTNNAAQAGFSGFKLNYVQTPCA